MESWMVTSHCRRTAGLEINPLIKYGACIFFRSGNSIRRRWNYMSLRCPVHSFIFIFYDAAMFHPQGKSEVPVCLQTPPFVLVQGMWMLSALTWVWDASCFRP